MYVIKTSLLEKKNVIFSAFAYELAFLGKKMGTALL